jgi:hypothetical protein
MALTKATQSVITPNIATTDTRQTITGEKVIQALYSTSSTTSLTIGTGSKTLTVGTGLTWVAGRDVFITNGSTRSMSGSVTSYDPITGVMVANITTTGGGTGTYASWTVTQQTGTALPALRITSNDVASAFVVEDSANPDLTPFSVSSSGNVNVGNSCTITSNCSVGGNLSVVSNASVNGNLRLLNPSSSTGWFAVTGGGNTSGRGFNNIINTQYLTNSWSLQKTTNAITVSLPATGSIVYNLLDPANLYLEFQELLGSTQILSGGFGGTLQLKIMSYVIATTVATGVQVQTVGAYTSPVFVVNALTNSSNFTGFTLNGVTTATNITTVDGLAQTAGGIPATGYATIQATAATTTANGEINLTLRGHTTLDNATTTFVSYTTAEIICSNFYAAAG